MILLDTNALLFLLADHARAQPLNAHLGELCLSPVSLLELQFLAEVGRGRFTVDDPLQAVQSDPRWSIDEAPLLALMECALELSWTRDPFDRLLAAHALCRNMRLATSDRTLLKHLPRGNTLSL